MEKVVKYKCELCGTYFDTPDEARRCEERHVVAEVIEKQANFRGAKGYPGKLEVSFSDGNIGIYELYGVEAAK